MINAFYQLNAQDYKVVRFDDIQQIMETKNDTLYVLNFWATWCKPCVEELPFFDEMQERYQDQKMKIILISLDFQSQIESKFKPFLQQRKLKSEVWFLNESKFNKFIPQVDQNWSGALPFTLFLRESDQYRSAKEGAFLHGELKTIFDNIFDN